MSISQGEQLHHLTLAAHGTLDLCSELLVRLTYPGYKDMSTEWPERTKGLIRNTMMLKELLKQDINKSKFEGSITDPAPAPNPDDGPRIITPEVLPS